MSFVGDILSDITGSGDAADAARDAGQLQSDAAVEAAQIQAGASNRAAELQQETARKGIQFQQNALNQIRGDLAPFRDVGTSNIGAFNNQLNSLNNLINNQQAQADFIQNNPFFQAVADDAQQRIFGNQAAKGKLGSGGTAAGLQNELVLLSNQLLNDEINRKVTGTNAFQNAVTLGQNAAAQTGSATQSTGNVITNLLSNAGNAGAQGILNAANAGAGGITGSANALASGLVGGANAVQQGIGNLFQVGGTAAALALSDRRFKHNLRLVDHIGEIPVYLFNYVGYKDDILGVMAQDVEKVDPGSVLEIDGIKYVDYTRSNKWSPSIH